MKRRHTFITLIGTMLHVVCSPAHAADDDDAITVKHLSTIHNGLSKYLEAHGGVWPQTPLDLDVAAGQKWWIETLRPFGVTAEDWTDPRDGGTPPQDRMTYAVTSFDDQPHRAFRWPNQPWVVTSAFSKKSKQIHLLLPDGSMLTQASKFVQKVGTGINKK